MYSSLILTDLAHDRQHDLIAAADAQRIARFARAPRRTQSRERRKATTSPLV
jgi:hypothetical protein